MQDDILDAYTEVSEIIGVDIIHIYPGKLIGKNGINNSRFFEVIGFNTVTRERINLRRHDEIRPFDYDDMPISQVQVFRDKSTLIKFRKLVLCNNFYTRTLYLGK